MLDDVYPSSESAHDTAGWEVFETRESQSERVAGNAVPWTGSASSACRPSMTSGEVVPVHVSAMVWFTPSSTVVLDSCSVVLSLPRVHHLRNGW